MMKEWKCVKDCGACCHLEPEDRPELEQYLSPEELTHYLSLVGEDSWCIHFDQDTRLCRIYDQRPRFCRVTPENFQRMYGVRGNEFNEFAINCCKQQITSVYGCKSREMRQYMGKEA